MRFQKGRSMIEMLAVLAIIGVLAIGGIALYRRAVNNHHANTILDDANRLAFVITERGNFAPNDNIVGIEFNQTSTYSLVPFVGQKSGQYGIMVENVPKGVCEPLADKASVEYKVRVAAYGAIEYLDQDTSTGLVYDSFHKDICINDMNDVILYFGDTSAQCNKPEEGETHVKCLSNAECCGGAFCWFAEDSEHYPPEIGRCEEITNTNFPPETETMTDGRMWTRSVNTMNWWSAQNWCQALGLKPAARADIGCTEIVGEICDTSIVQGIQSKWGERTTGHWLEKNNASSSFFFVPKSGLIGGRNFKYINITYALCR